MPKQDHPRIRGNHADCFRVWLVDPGSPPHTREPPFRRRCHRGRDRITPAYAGTTQSFLLSLVSNRDHPRIRGNHGTAYLQIINALGSPPHTREPQSIDIMLCSAMRITPAYAGTTRSIPEPHSHTGDHPRIRGNHTQVCQNRRRWRGSPPHTREPHGFRREAAL